jgi:serine/threonine protein kinase
MLEDTFQVPAAAAAAAAATDSGAAGGSSISRATSSGGGTYIITECLEGGNVLSRILRPPGRFTERDASVAIRKVLTGLAGLHRVGVLHRDLAPENLVYVSAEADSDIKIIDFGLSLLTRGAPLHSVCASPHLVGKLVSTAGPTTLGDASKHCRMSFLQPTA